MFCQNMVTASFTPTPSVFIDLHWLKSSNHRCTDCCLTLKLHIMSALGASFTSSADLEAYFFGVVSSTNTTFAASILTSQSIFARYIAITCT